nr:MAG TPA_asm: hypothetical protein [Bacteriophage sp.]
MFSIYSVHITRNLIVYFRLVIHISLGIYLILCVRCILSNTFNMLINSCVAINNLVNSRCNPLAITIDKYVVLR